MIYGNKLSFVMLFLSFFFIIGCTTNKNFYYELYDGYTIKSVDKEVKLYKDSNLIKINDLNYQIQEFKYNSDVVCLHLTTGDYYMIYYVDSSIYGPFNEESLNSSIKSLSMTFENDFVDINTVEGKVYE